MVRIEIPAATDNAHGSERNVKRNTESSGLRPLRPTRLPLREIGGDDPTALDRGLDALARVVVRAMRRRGMLPQEEPLEDYLARLEMERASQAGEEVENL